ncbi:MAG TPA: large conductance mechanosensitive channel protein MscL [Vicinamibacterales bacterium]|nr:large conductance mechanosensitive channel protein MscL [Vicinamibacterales bacterium]
MLSEFKAFVNQGNALDLAVGVVIGVAFGKIVNSLVADIIMPVVSLATRRVDFQNLFYALGPGGPFQTIEAAREAGSVIAYGAFLNMVVEFLVIAFSIFIVVRQINRWRGTAPEKAA